MNRLSELEPRTDRLPMLALLALATAVFVTSLTETLPAGLLPKMSASLGVGESAAGQTITVYAIGTALTTIPLTAATVRWRRKVLLQMSIIGFAAANSVTAVSSIYEVTMAARFVAGMAAGVAWALLAGYARRLVPVHLQGRAIAVAMAGIPVALALGVPAGTYVGNEFGWRVAFWVMTAVAVVLIGWVALLVPDFPGSDVRARAAVVRTLAIPGVGAVLFVTFAYVLAHTIFYTYIAPFLDSVGFGGHVDVALLVFGVACLGSIWLVGSTIDRRLCVLMIASTVLFAVAATALAIAGRSPIVLYAALILWGMAWGGAPTLLQTAAGIAGGSSADQAQALLVTLWNAAMAVGGVVGGVLLSHSGPRSLPWAALVILVPTLGCVLWESRRSGGREARSSTP
ncbi:MFS transporter [Rhodococcoides yunnanense]|uniref:MFS transporter n=1 Tax=Rhodococcoides yunnanense TaxID=278209 RepID=UPI000933E9C4|nr:MFS transporter [Rhodococcus yunnanensis]